jgi:hypothetical protein
VDLIHCFNPRSFVGKSSQQISLLPFLFRESHGCIFIHDFKEGGEKLSVLGYYFKGGSALFHIAGKYFLLI